MANESMNTAATKEDQKPEPELFGMLLKDITVIFAALAIWGSADHWATNSGLSLALVTAVGAALIAGWLIASLFHEWGHYFGAKIVKSRAPRMTLPGLLFFRYNFDLERNSLAQFTSMSVAGSLAHWGVFVAAVLLLPMTSLAQTAFVSATFAFAVFGSIVEWPIIARTSLRRIKPIEAFQHIDGNFLFRHQVIGGGAGLIFLVYFASG